MTIDTNIRTNIKNLPEGNYYTELCWSDTHPWVEVGRTAKTIKLARVRVAKDPDWKPEMIPGGFAAHCTNQSSQTWLYDGIDEACTVTIRETKRGWANRGVRYKPNMAREYYDYNF